MVSDAGPGAVTLRGSVQKCSCTTSLMWGAVLILQKAHLKRGNLPWYPSSPSLHTDGGTPQDSLSGSEVVFATSAATSESVSIMTALKSL